MLTLAVNVPIDDSDADLLPDYPTTASKEYVQDQQITEDIYDQFGKRFNMNPAALRDRFVIPVHGDHAPGVMEIDFTMGLIEGLKGDSAISDDRWRFFRQLTDWLRDNVVVEGAGATHTTAMIEKIVVCTGNARISFEKDRKSLEAYSHCYDALDACGALVDHLAERHRPG